LYAGRGFRGLRHDTLSACRGVARSRARRRGVRAVVVAALETSKKKSAGSGIRPVTVDARYPRSPAIELTGARRGRQYIRDLPLLADPGRRCAQPALIAEGTRPARTPPY